MESYTFYNGYYNTSGMRESDVLIFAKNGNTLRTNIFDIFPNVNDGDSFDTFKNDLDLAVHNYFYNGNSGGSLILGYVYWQYDYDYELVIDRQEVTHFIVGNTSNFSINGYRMQYEQEGDEYLGLFNGASSNVIYRNNSYLIEYNYNMYADFSHSVNAMNGILYDYTLSNDSTFTLVGSADAFYNSYFDLSNNGTYYFRFGEKTDEYEIGYRDGYLNGFTSGEGNGYTHGRSDGYQAGYYEGLAEGGNAPQSVFGIVGGAINSFTPVLNIEILPHITLGTCISIPIICVILVAIFKIARG